MLPNAPVPSPARPLYTRIGSALSYSAMVGASAMRGGGLIDSSAAPFLSLIFMASVSLDAHYTDVGGRSQLSDAQAAHTQLKALQAKLASLDGLPDAQRQTRVTELAGEMAQSLEGDPALLQEVLKACDLLVDIDTQARKAASNTSKVLIHQTDLPRWRESMGIQLAQKKEALKRRQRWSSPLHPTWLEQRMLKRLRVSVSTLEDRIRMYDTLGEKALGRIYVNLSATQAKQWRDVYCYGAAVALGGTAQIISAVDLLDNVTLPADAVLTATGLGTAASVISIYTNYLDAVRDAPREHARASRAKNITAQQISVLADTHGHGPRAFSKAVESLTHNRIQRYQDLHRLTIQSMIRQVKGWIGMKLGTLGVAAGAATIASLVLGTFTLGVPGIVLAVAGMCLTCGYLGSLVQLILSGRQRKLAMRVDEAVARLVQHQHGAGAAQQVMAAGVRQDLAISNDHLDQLQLSSRVRHKVERRLEKIRRNPQLLQANPYLGMMVLADHWLHELGKPPETADPDLLQLPVRLGIPDIQVLRIKGMVRAGEPVDKIESAAQTAFLQAFDLQLKVHDKGRAPTTGKGAGAKSPRDVAWAGMDDSRYGPMRSGAGPAPHPGGGARPAAPATAQFMQSVTAVLGPEGTGSAHGPNWSEQTQQLIKKRAWSLVWGVIKEDAQSRLRRPGGRWQRSTELLERWSRDSADQSARRQQRLREKLKERIQNEAATERLAGFEVTPTFLDEVLMSAIQQADRLGAAWPVAPVGGASSLTPRVQRHYQDVAGLAQMLLPHDLSSPTQDRSDRSSGSWIN